MIIDIRKLLHKISSKKDKAENCYTFDMSFDGRYFKPSITNQSNKINVIATLPSGAEFVGFAIIAKCPVDDKISVLTTNGLFIRPEDIRANTVLLFPSYAEISEAITQIPQYITRASNKPYLYEMYSCYQLDNKNTLEFKKVNN